MSETLYNVEYYESLLCFISHCLKEDGIVIIGSKTYYYGLGGGYYEFMKFLEKQKDNGYTLEIAEKLNDLKSIERLVIIMKREDKVSNITK